MPETRGATPRTDERTYNLGDAHFHIMILVTTAGAASVTSTPYGVLTVYDASWANTRSTSSYANAYTCTGRQLDAETGLYYFRARLFHAQLGRFVNRDPVSGETNLSRYCLNRPSDLADPQGLYPIFVCCNFENSSGSKIWPETISCDSSMTPASCCAARAKGWGWLPAWRVLHAQYGECGNACRFYLMQSEVPVETAGGECEQFTSSCLGGHWDLVSSCDGMVWSGIVGPVGRHWTMDLNLPINRDVFGYKTCEKTNGWSGLTWGRPGVKGKSCASASYWDILDCIRSKPQFVGDWGWFNNCQTDVQEAISGCCLQCRLDLPSND